MSESLRLGNPLDQPQIGMDWVPSHWKFQLGDENRFWIVGTAHSPRPITPLDLDTVRAACIVNLGWAAANTSVPTSRGNAYRLLNGRSYAAGTPVTDPEEIDRRTRKFERVMAYYLSEWDQLWARSLADIERWLDWMDSFDYEKEPDPKDPTQAYSPVEYFDRLMDSLFRIERYHFEFLYIVHSYTKIFRTLCKELVPGTRDAECDEMLQGFGNKLMETDEQFWALGKLAVDLDVDDIVMHAPLDEVIPCLEETDKGGKWLEQFRKVVHDWGMRHLGGCVNISEPSWSEDPSYPISFIRGFMERAARGETLTPKERLAEAREKTIKGFRRKIESDDERKKFDKALGDMQKLYAWSEDHNFYVEGATNSLFHLKMVELGRRLVNEGYMEEPYDIFFLVREEVRRLLIELALKTFEGRVYNRIEFRPRINQRRQEWQKQLDSDFPMALGMKPAEAIGDPEMEMTYGSSLDRVERIRDLVGGDEEIIEIRGAPASPGICEGIARVLYEVSDLKDVQPGEVLVCRDMNPMWNPVFAKITGLATDTGGTLSHAGIVSREYGIPSIVGTMSSTKLIKTGDRVRLDGNRGIITRIRPREG
jgi:pyruvate,water dikinase